MVCRIGTTRNRRRRRLIRSQTPATQIVQPSEQLRATQQTKERERETFTLRLSRQYDSDGDFLSHRRYPWNPYVLYNSLNPPTTTTRQDTFETITYYDQTQIITKMNREQDIGFILLDEQFQTERPSDSSDISLPPITSRILLTELFTLSRSYVEFVEFSFPRFESQLFYSPVDPRGYNQLTELQGTLQIIQARNAVRTSKYWDPNISFLTNDPTKQDAPYQILDTGRFDTSTDLLDSQIIIQQPFTITINPFNFIRRQIDGDIYTIIYDSFHDQFYIGGKFQVIETINGQTEPSIQQRTLIRTDRNGFLDMSFRPSFEQGSIIYTIQTYRTQEQTKIIVGGGFSQVNAISRTSNAQLNYDGSVDISFNVTLTGESNITVHKIVVSNEQDTIYMGGLFTEVNRRIYQNFVRVTTTGQVDTTMFNPQFTELIYDFVIDRETSTIYVTGKDTRRSNVGETVTGPKVLLTRINLDGTPNNQWQLNPSTLFSDESELTQRNFIYYDSNRQRILISTKSSYYMIDENGTLQYRRRYFLLEDETRSGITHFQYIPSLQNVIICSSFRPEPDKVVSAEIGDVNLGSFFLGSSEPGSCYLESDITIPTSVNLGINHIIFETGGRVFGAAVGIVSGQLTIVNGNYSGGLQEDVQASYNLYGTVPIDKANSQNINEINQYLHYTWTGTRYNYSVEISSNKTNLAFLPWKAFNGIYIGTEGWSADNTNDIYNTTTGDYIGDASLNGINGEWLIFSRNVKFVLKKIVLYPRLKTGTDDWAKTRMPRDFTLLGRLNNYPLVKSLNFGLDFTSTSYSWENGNYFVEASSTIFNSNGDPNFPVWEAFNGIAEQTIGKNGWASGGDPNGTTSEARYAENGSYIGSASLGGRNGEWIYIQFPNSVVCNEITLYSRSGPQMPTEFSILGSNDGTNWTILTTKTGISWSDNDSKLIEFTNTMAYNHYAIVCERLGNLSTAFNCVLIGEIEFSNSLSAWTQIEQFTGFQYATDEGKEILVNNSNSYTDYAIVVEAIGNKDNQNEESKNNVNISEIEFYEEADEKNIAGQTGTLGMEFRNLSSNTWQVALYWNDEMLVESQPKNIRTNLIGGGDPGGYLNFQQAIYKPWNDIQNTFSVFPNASSQGELRAWIGKTRADVYPPMRNELYPFVLYETASTDSVNDVQRIDLLNEPYFEVIDKPIYSSLVKSPPSQTTDELYISGTIQQRWFLLGEPVSGDISDIQFGQSITCNAQGTRFITVSNENAFVYTFHTSISTWVQDTSFSLIGTNGHSVGMNGDGTILAIGSPDDSSSGQVVTYIYDSSSQSWNTYGSRLYGTQIGEQFGYSLELNEQGTKLAVGSPLYSMSNNFQGKVYVYSYNILLQDWVQEQQFPLPTQPTLSSNSFYGISVSFNSDGTNLVVGAPSTIEEVNSGQVFLYEYNTSEGQWDSSSYLIIDSSFYLSMSTTTQYFTRYGFSVDINSNGTLVAIGADGGGKYRGKVQVYRIIDISTQQIELFGNTIIGNDIFSSFGKTVRLSRDSSDTTLSVGAPTFDGDSGIERGIIRVYSYNISNATWDARGIGIRGKKDNENVGISYAMNQEGTIFFVGVPSHGLQGEGQVRVLRYIDEPNGDELGVDRSLIVPSIFHLTPDTTASTLFQLDTTFSTHTIIQPGITENLGQFTTNILNQPYIDITLSIQSPLPISSTIYPSLNIEFIIQQVKDSQGTLYEIYQNESSVVSGLDTSYPFKPSLDARNPIDQVGFRDPRVLQNPLGYEEKRNSSTLTIYMTYPDTLKIPSEYLEQDIYLTLDGLDETLNPVKETILLKPYLYFYYFQENNLYSYPIIPLGLIDLTRYQGRLVDETQSYPPEYERIIYQLRQFYLDGMRTRGSSLQFNPNAVYDPEGLDHYTRRLLGQNAISSRYYITQPDGREQNEDNIGIVPNLLLSYQPFSFRTISSFRIYDTGFRVDNYQGPEIDAIFHPSGQYRNPRTNQRQDLPNAINSYIIGEYEQSGQLESETRILPPIIYDENSPFATLSGTPIQPISLLITPALLESVSPLLDNILIVIKYCLERRIESIESADETEEMNLLIEEYFSTSGVDPPPSSLGIPTNDNFTLLDEETREKIETRLVNVSGSFSYLVNPDKPYSLTQFSFTNATRTDLRATIQFEIRPVAQTIRIPKLNSQEDLDEIDVRRIFSYQDERSHLQNDIQYQIENRFQLDEDIAIQTKQHFWRINRIMTSYPVSYLNIVRSQRKEEYNYSYFDQSHGLDLYILEPYIQSHFENPVNQTILFEVDIQLYGDTVLEFSSETGKEFSELNLIKDQVYDYTEPIYQEYVPLTEKTTQIQRQFISSSQRIEISHDLTQPNRRFLFEAYQAIPIQYREFTLLSPIEQVSMGHDHGLVLLANGEVYVTGQNEYGQLGLGNTTEQYFFTRLPIESLDGLPVVEVCAGAYHSMIRVEQGNHTRLYVFGRNETGQLGLGITENIQTPTRVPRLGSNSQIYAIQLSAGVQHSACLGSNQKLYTCGSNSYGQLGRSGETTRFEAIEQIYDSFTNEFTSYSACTDISCGWYHTIALFRPVQFRQQILTLSDSPLVYTWGRNHRGQLGHGFSETILQQKSFPEIVLLDSSGSVSRNVSSISGGGEHTLYLIPPNNIYSFGDNQYNQLGRSTGTVDFCPFPLNIEFTI
mgnify:CR=1 FL=1